MKKYMVIENCNVSDNQGIFLEQKKQIQLKNLFILIQILKGGQTFTNNLVKNSFEFLSIKTPKVLCVIPKISFSDSLIYNGRHTLSLTDLL